MVTVVPYKITERANPMKDKKRVRISSRRQFSIPKEFYELLDMDDEAIVELYGNRLVIRPVSKEDAHQSDFVEHIYEDVINDGYEGYEIINEVNRRKKMIKPAIDTFINESVENSEPLNIDNLFDDHGDE